MTTRHEIAVRVAGREFAMVNPLCKNLNKHVKGADIDDWLAAPERDLGAEWAEITGDDFLGNYEKDSSALGEALYDDTPDGFACTLLDLRDIYACHDIVRRARPILLEMIENADSSRDAAERESESKEQHQKDTAT